MMVQKNKICLALLLTIIGFSAQAQINADAEYLNMVKERAYKIVVPLGISDSSKFYKVRDKIAQEYVDIKNIDAKKTVLIADIKANKLEKSAADAQIAKINSQTEKSKEALNKKFVKFLKKKLTPAQVDQVKDGMTYNVLPKTYQAHLDMIPTLKEEEKKYIFDALVEAREHAMAAGSSDAKHGWFGKYKGRINNYLSARGYDLTKEREGWAERIKAAKK